ncbi:PIG-L deacetylase family protein [Candidatus Pelagibacter bacterium nBUS_49]|uniref:PIG-L deacetylase family protein n=1 Tax=Candidatus Pelagibacter bacterium nBUS_49 TaxID=3374196 RepID=UPI003EB98DE3
MDKKKILIIAPHADDEILGCGGFISKYSKKNYKINVLILTNANKGAPEIYSYENIKTIRNESKLANLSVGTNKLFFENLPGLNLTNYPIYKISNIIDNYIKKINPEVILIPSIYDIHDDHKIIFKAAKVAMRPNKKNNIKKILSYEVLSETEWNENGKSFNPNYYVKLKKSELDSKINAFLKYKSQVKKHPHPRSKESIINLSRLRGSQVFAQFAEAFKVEKIID